MSNRLGGFSPVGNAKLSVIPYLSLPMFSLAEDLARTAFITKDMRTVLGCVILSAATLEAYINEVIEMWFSNDTAEAKAFENAVQCRGKVARRRDT